MAPAVYDCMSAMIAEQVGFKAVFMSGFCLNVTAKGLPDIGTETRTETTNIARNIAGSIEIPVFVDAADGYGGPVGVFQTIRELEMSGAAGCFIEDQVSPPKCPLLGPPEVIPLENFLRKLKVALEARQDKDFVIIARTDSAAKLGVEEAIRRGIASRDAGADVILLGGGAPRDKEALRQLVKAIDAPIMVPPAFDLGLTLKDYEEIGIKIVSGLEVILAASKAIKDVFSELHKEGSVKEGEYHFGAVTDLGQLLNWNKWFEFDMNAG